MPPPGPQPKKRESPLTSNSSTEPELFKIGRLGRPHGLEGFMGLYADDGDVTLLQAGSLVLIDGQTYSVRSVRRADKGFQIAFEGVSDRSTAERLRGRDVYSQSRRQLADQEYWASDLIGLEVRTVDGESVGQVADVINGPTQDRLVVQSESILEIPFVDELVPEVDLEAGVVRIRPLPGLINGSSS